MVKRLVPGLLVVVGGIEEDVDRYRSLSRHLGVQSRVQFLGRRPLTEIGDLMAAADVLVSPRIRGGNAPMKIYSYMHSGKPILATDLPTHRQILAGDCALLRPPEPEAFAEGMARLALDPQLRQTLGERARSVARERYGVATFERTVDSYGAWMENLVAERLRLGSPLAVHFAYRLPHWRMFRQAAIRAPGEAAVVGPTPARLPQTPGGGPRAARETGDVESSSDDYARRFAGPAGSWLLGLQERIALELLARQPARTVLDVGGGHGQLARPLCDRGYDVTILGSSELCRRRVASLVQARRCRFVAADLLTMPFPDASFDVALCFRLLAHCERWPELLRELCRAARQAVIAEYPTSQGPNALGSLFFGAKKRIEGNTRPWRSFRHAELERELAANGFGIAASVPELFLPTLLHRQLGSARVSSAMEGACRGLGLTRRWGSPVILMATRDARSRMAVAA